MSESHCLLIGCAILKKEVEYLFAEQGWPCSRIFLPSSLHFDFDQLRETLDGTILKNSGKETLLLYGTCYPGIDQLATVRRIPCQNCVEMLLGPERFKEQLENGAYFLLEEWATNWDEILEKTFGNREVAREIFQLDRRFLLALRTPCSGEFSAAATAAADSVGLPLRWLDVSLDHLKQQLELLLAVSPEQTAQADLVEQAVFHKQRADRLAAEKSSLQLVTTMMNRLSALPGLENTVQNLLELVVDSIGGTNAELYYFIDDTVWYTNLEGIKQEGVSIADPLLQEALQAGQPVHTSHDFQNTLMHTRNFASASSWAVPLQTGESLVGVFKIENMHLDSGELLPNLGAFFRYAALILKNEIQSYVQLQQAYQTLKQEKDQHVASKIQLEQALTELSEAQSQIYQQEKMASIGQLAAGVAHEINNPMGYITSNLSSLDKYVSRVTEFITTVDQALQQCADRTVIMSVQEARKRLKIDRILEDAHQLITESQDGTGRVRRIVQDLKSFSRIDQAETALIDLNESLETTINIAWNELKYVAELNRNFGEIPRVRCFPQQLNQVFLNLLVNAAHALGSTRGQITIGTRQEGDQVLVTVSDTGCGISPEVQRHIFEPFFTTKEVGKGTGLGLSISYDIIKKHGGEITVESEPGRGTVFTVRLPIDVQQEEA